MRIVIHGRCYPSIGGIETIINLLAREWLAAGMKVVVVSNLGCGRAQRREPNFPVIYRPAPLRWLHLVRWADLVLHLNLSLKALWPHLLVRRPIVISHQSCYKGIGPIGPMGPMGRIEPRRRLKLWFMHCATNIAASRAVARSIGVACEIIPNPYDSALFHPLPTVPRDRELIFVGRLVSEKGVDLLIEAFQRLETRWPAIQLTIVGEGPERTRLVTVASRLGLAERIRFLGALDHTEVAPELRRHRILVVPSTYEEPFGIVALEGAACGCAVLGSDGGGLSEAIGPAGNTFRRGDLNDLTMQLDHLLTQTPQTTVTPGAVVAHLEHHQPVRIAAEYIRIFRLATARERAMETDGAPAAWARH